jgi:formylmethanofuran dehydrogenase subunit B
MPETCLGCGCACDDIEIRADGDSILEARNACPLGVTWFGDGRVPSRALVGGREIPLDEALDAAASILISSSRTLVLVAADVSCEAQRAAIALADFLHATIDSLTSAAALPSLLAAQEAGRPSATLGEIRNRADVVVFWGVDPAHRYPRFTTRYAPEPTGMHTPNGRRSRRVVAVDVGDARGPADADIRFTVMPDREVATLTELTAGIVSRRASPDTSGLMDALAGGNYVAIVVDAEQDDAMPVDRGRAAALIALAQALNEPTRCALITLRGGGNRSGADACMTSQTGYPMAVDFSRGYPRYLPHDGAAPRLARRDLDAALVVGSVAPISHSFAAGLAAVPCVVIGPRATTGALAHAAVSIDTAVIGIHESGTALRMDDVPLPLRAVITGPPAAADVLHALETRLAVAPAAVNRR